MALDPRISLAARAPNIAPAINIFENALMNAQTRDIRGQQATQQALLSPLQVQQQQQSVDINQQTLDANQLAQEQQAENRILRNVSEFGTKLKPVIASGNLEQAQGMLANRLIDLQEQGLPTNETVEAITALRNGDTQSVISAIDSIQTIAQQRGLTGTSLLSIGQRDFNSNVAAVKADPNLETIEGRAASVALGLTAKASLTKDERIANDEALGVRVAEQKGAEASATEGAKLTKQLKHKPSITKAVKLAEKAATERGEVLTDLSRMEAGLPGLNDAVSQLKELSAIATSTIGGKIFDQAVKQTGFGSTKGATARAKMVAIITNQTLPLLKETFGSAFTETEGKRLEASFADPDATHEERLAQLDAFIDQKVRTIETKQRQLDAGEEQSTAPTIIRFDAQGNQI